MKPEQLIVSAIAIVVFIGIAPTLIEQISVTTNSTLNQNVSQRLGSLGLIFPVVISAGVVIAVVRHFLSAPQEVDIPALDEDREYLDDYYESTVTYESLSTEVECPYCQTMYSQTEPKCPNCYAPRRR